ncbi:PolA DNA polymerase I - 3'-5' exonuclease and polymerase domains [uncultured Caudovirales phage]|uniref:PolA DNA polymerase I - 3'-5' exonuclease and polymerase domains n=1 Tax=uncultured Caudovirales phage TaxID=2100421 RepID=A0A6J5QK73_9CAUD|nr:PolA DNA polymerase I - 3'-5' exonuclease and polymerase domains [uncultured Caudovirales phage]CAB4169370.1 PolA DNA polymerase I - 3'-5' exonuclease and polymerase domains [uncultured Caudovirales phage]CAB4181368.1 PolA DNA polymerase I - 3'-5' exonuclease and polymerase domains [uncultured Caudovirales phage]CAB4190092.1 PolA DNA polymerase I - 3'-5' exonuclease and polymerase domains [uncultured Caudovirales phage]CAB4196053.1 PolA DNA polymerase I - 3'-5' exonuclease and polymerase dom
MDVYTLDFETYYDKDFSLSKITTEEYVRSPLFETIGLGIKKNDGPTYWLAGEKRVAHTLSRIDWSNAAILCHNTMFDGAILSWRYGVKPKAWFDTLCMARAIHGVEKSASLKALAEKYEVGEKGDEVINALGKRLVDFTKEELAQYGEYCRNDVDLTYTIFNQMLKKFPKQELKLIDHTLRMYINPILELDGDLLEMHLQKTKLMKEDLLTSSGATKEDLMSNAKLAAILREYGAEVPMKISPTTGKLTYAMAKNDEEFKALAEHEDFRVQAVVAARLGTKSTLEETRTQRFIDISKRGALPVPVRYYAAHTGRWGGDDKINLQNLPSRGPNAKVLKRAIIAPEGMTIIESDSAQIEARVLAWLAEQDDLVEAFAEGKDVYKKMAAKIYSVAETEVTKEQRFVGKTTILGAGYGMGGPKFQAALMTQGMEVTQEEAKRIITIYRDENEQITNLWKRAGYMLRALANGEVQEFGRAGVLSVDPEGPGVVLPSGLILRYDGLRGHQNADGTEYTYQTRKGPNRIYGGKVIENVCQAIARCIIGDQMLRIAKKYRAVLTVHDSIVCCVPDDEVAEAKAWVEQSMRWVPEWAEGLPVNCEAGVGKNYGDCE